MADTSISRSIRLTATRPLPQRFFSLAGAAWSAPKEPGTVHEVVDAELSACCQDLVFETDESGWVNVHHALMHSRRIRAQYLLVDHSGARVARAPVPA